MGDSHVGSGFPSRVPEKGAALKVKPLSHIFNRICTAWFQVKSAVNLQVALDWSLHRVVNGH